MDHGSDWFGRTLEENNPHGQPIPPDPPDEMNRISRAASTAIPFSWAIVSRVEYQTVAFGGTGRQRSRRRGQPVRSPERDDVYTGEQFPKIAAAVWPITARGTATEGEMLRPQSLRRGDRRQLGAQVS
jgi:hypothetical protein